MLRKCFKYDFKSVFKIWWIAAATVLGLSFAAGFGIKNLVLHASDPGKSFILEATAIVLFYFSVFAIFILTAVLLGIRYYSNFFSDEGYLTFTLPVKRTTLFFSKFLSGFVFQLMCVGVVFASLVVITLIVPSNDKANVTLLGEIIHGIIEIVREIPKNELIWFYIYVAEAVLTGLALSVFSVLLLYMLITLGSTAVKRFKAGATIGFLVGGNYVLSALVFPVMMSFVLWLNAAFHLYEETISNFAGFSLFALLFFFVSLVIITASVLFYCIIQGSLERKLNLS